MAYSLGFAHGRITLSYNGGPAAAQLRADLLRIMASSRAAHEGVQSFGKQMDKLGAGLVTAAQFAGKAALGITAFANAMAAATVVAVNLAPVVAAAFAVLPGVILGGVVAMGVFKIATMGVGDALKAAGGDSKTFEEAIKGLSPQAQKFARAWRDAGQSLKPVQQAMQNAFFNKTGPEINKISKAALGLKKEAVGTAEGFNQVFRRVLEFGSSGTAIVTVRSLLNGVRAMLLRIAPAVKPLLTGFFNLARQAGQFGDALGGGIASGMVKFGNFLNNVNLEGVFDRAMEVLRPLGDLLKNIGSIISSVFTGLALDGGASLGVIGEMVGVLADFLKTAEGQEGLGAIGAAIQAIAGATGEVFLALLKELTPVLVTLAPGIAEFATTIADILVPAIETAGPVLNTFAGFLTDHAGTVAKIAVAIYALAAAMKVYNAIAKVVEITQRILNSTMLLSVIAWIRTTTATVAASVATAYHAVVTKVVAAATRIWTAIQWLFNAALVANPIGIVVVAIIALIAIIVVIATKTTWFQDAWKWAWGGIKDAASAVWEWIRDTLWPGIKSVWEWITDFIAAHVAVIKSVFSSIWGAIQAVIGFFTRLKDSVLGKLGELLNFIKSLPGMIGDALGNLGGLLWEKGKSLVQGFIDGIKFMFNKVRDTAKNLVGMVTDFLPGSPAKDGPLSGKGWTPFRGKSLVDGLMTGMESQLSSLERVAEQVAATAVPLLPTLGGAAGLSPSTVPVPAAQPQQHAETIVIETLQVNISGVLDMTDPQAARQIAVRISEAIDKVKKEYK